MIVGIIPGCSVTSTDGEERREMTGRSDRIEELARQARSASLQEGQRLAGEAARLRDGGRRARDRGAGAAAPLLRN